MNIKKTFVVLLVVFMLTFQPVIPLAENNEKKDDKVNPLIIAGGIIAGAIIINSLIGGASSIINSPVGGFITYYNPVTCKIPVGINFSTMHAAVGSGRGVWMMLPGSIPKLNPAPIHPGQAVLGLATKAYVPCLTPTHHGPKVTGPGGNVIWYIGGNI